VVNTNPSFDPYVGTVQLPPKRGVNLA
jgi:hypothetical protein